MRWRKLGLVYGPDGTLPWARTHAAVPTPYLLDETTIRVFVTGYDDRGRGRPGYVDVLAHDPTRVLRVSSEPLLDVGQRGCFDDNGLVATSLIDGGAGRLFLYYAGFEICTRVRYRILTGLAISTDGGASFTRHSRAPILERSDTELYFRCGPFVEREDGRFRIWYVAGSDWTTVGEKEVPVYDLRTASSDDGITWPTAGRVSMQLTDSDEHGFGRPWIIRRPDGSHRLFYSIRKRSVGDYRLGYAESRDGVAWTRMDDQMGLDVTPGAFDSSGIMYSAVIEIAGRTYCFYNGDNFGAKGFGVAVLVA